MSNYRPHYSVEICHDGLNKYRVIRGTDEYVLRRQAEAQLRAWDEMWEKRQSIESAREERRAKAEEKEAKKNLAIERTAEAQEALANISETLSCALNLTNRFDWESLLDSSPYDDPMPPKPSLFAYPIEPKASDSDYLPVKKWYFVFSRKRAESAAHHARQKYERAHKEWQNKVRDLEGKNRLLDAEWRDCTEKWQKDCDKFKFEQAKRNFLVANKKHAYFSGDSQAVAEYFDMVLSNSQYADFFPHEWSLQYVDETKMVVVDYFLPAPGDLPTLKEVRYIVARDEFQEINVSESVANRAYDRLLYQVCLRTIHEIFKSDQVGAAVAVVFNGWVRSIDLGTGQKITACLMSVQAPLCDFNKIDLRHVDPKVCFKTLKGVGSSKLHGLSPIAPILQINKEDKRFISSYSVVGDVDKSTNLAAMDWEDFEHLIRELFEAEFSEGGGEVKITQASHDGGVDAVAFDPDPIRGGKIVIQAKRYTNTVAVSAVRDLYGTVLSEGATKGILVTTADYGPDAYGFAKGKPLTLLSGANLLSLLEKHGHKATIDLKAAKQLLADRKVSE